MPSFWTSIGRVAEDTSSIPGAGLMLLTGLVRPSAPDAPFWGGPTKFGSDSGTGAEGGDEGGDGLAFG